jgi:hypothetical protein
LAPSSRARERLATRNTAASSLAPVRFAPFNLAPAKLAIRQSALAYPNPRARPGTPLRRPSQVRRQPLAAFCRASTRRRLAPIHVSRRATAASRFNAETQRTQRGKAATEPERQTGKLKTGR